MTIRYSPAAREDLRSLRRYQVGEFGAAVADRSVRKYVGCRYDKGRRLPVKGPTVGHIRDGVYVPVEEDAAAKEPQVDLRDWANAALCDRIVSRFTLSEMCSRTFGLFGRLVSANRNMV